MQGRCQRARPTVRLERQQKGALPPDRAVGRLHAAPVLLFHLFHRPVFLEQVGHTGVGRGSAAQEAPHRLDVAGLGEEVHGPQVA